jgi:pimeloyl-ACP methyl ester carboxylesterase
MKAIALLPGLDGTGLLFGPALDACPDGVRPVVLPLPDLEARSYAELADHLAPRLPKDEPFLLLGESFSGPLALELAARRPDGLAGVVLVASFVTSPVPRGIGRLPWTLAFRVRRPPGPSDSFSPEGIERSRSSCERRRRPYRRRSSPRASVSPPPSTPASRSPPVGSPFSPSRRAATASSGRGRWRPSVVSGWTSRCEGSQGRTCSFRPHPAPSGILVSHGRAASRRREPPRPTSARSAAGATAAPPLAASRRAGASTRPSPRRRSPASRPISSASPASARTARPGSSPRRASTSARWTRPPGPAGAAIAPSTRSPRGPRWVTRRSAPCSRDSRSAAARSSPMIAGRDTGS